MAWKTVCDDTNKIPGKRREISDGPIGYLTGSSGIGGVADIKSMYRKRVIESYTYVGVDLATADAYVAANPSSTVYTPAVYTGGVLTTPGFTTKTEVSRDPDGGGGCYKVSVNSEITYDYSSLTP